MKKNIRMRKSDKPGDMYKRYKSELAPVRRATQETKHKNWIQGAIKHPGALHKELGVPAGKKIPASKLAAAAKKKGVVGKRARLAQTLKSFKHKNVAQVMDSASKKLQNVGKSMRKNGQTLAIAVKTRGIHPMNDEAVLKNKKRKMKKKEHSADAIKGLRKFVDEEAKEKRMKGKKRKSC